MQVKQLHILKQINLSLFFFLVLLGCSSNTNGYQVKNGIYASKLDTVSTLWDKIFGKLGTTIGDTLELDANGSFESRSCGGIKYGEYYQKGDSLILQVERSLYFKNDSADNNHYTISYFIENENELYVDIDGYYFNEENQKVKKKFRTHLFLLEE